MLSLVAEEEMVEPASTTEDRFVDVVPIDSGAYAKLYKGRDTRLARNVALKFFRTERTASDILNHAKATARLEGPFIVKIFEVLAARDPNDGVHRDCIVMEFIEGSSLLKRIEAGHIQIGDARRWAEQTITAVDFIISRHSHYHEDIHSGNILVRNETGDIVVIDAFASDAPKREVSHAERAQHDVRCLQTLLSELFEAVEPPVSSPGIETFRNATPTSIAELRAALRKLIPEAGRPQRSRHLILPAAVMGVLAFVTSIALWLPSSKAPPEPVPPGLPGLSAQLSIAVLHHSSKPQYLIDIGTSPDRNRVSLYLAPNDDLVLQARDASGVSHATVTPLHAQIIAGAPVSLAIDVASTPDGALLALRVDGVVKQSLALEGFAPGLQLSALTVGSNQRGAEPASFDLAALLLYEKTLSDGQHQANARVAAFQMRGEGPCVRFENGAWARTIAPPQLAHEPVQLTGSTLYPGDPSRPPILVSSCSSR